MQDCRRRWGCACRYVEGGSAQTCPRTHTSTHASTYARAHAHTPAALPAEETVASCAPDGNSVTRGTAIPPTQTPTHIFLTPFSSCLPRQGFNPYAPSLLGIDNALRTPPPRQPALGGRPDADALEQVKEREHRKRVQAEDRRAQKAQRAQQREADEAAMLALMPTLTRLRGLAGRRKGSAQAGGEGMRVDGPSQTAASTATTDRAEQQQQEQEQSEAKEGEEKSGGGNGLGEGEEALQGSRAQLSSGEVEGVEAAVPWAPKAIGPVHSVLGVAPLCLLPAFLQAVQVRGRGARPKADRLCVHVRLCVVGKEHIHPYAQMSASVCVSVCTG
jgi:hypothetical protein